MWMNIVCVLIVSAELKEMHNWKSFKYIGDFVFIDIYKLFLYVMCKYNQFVKLVSFWLKIDCEFDAMCEIGERV